MASGTLGDSNDDLNWGGRCRWAENCKVYTRRSLKKFQKTGDISNTATTTTSAKKPISATTIPADAEVCRSSTNTQNGTVNGNALRDSEGVVGATNVNSCQKGTSNEEQGHPHGSPGIYAHTQKQNGEGNDSHSGEVQDLEDTKMPDNDEADNFELRPQQRSEPSPARRSDSPVRQLIRNEEHNDGNEEQERSELPVSLKNDISSGGGDSSGLQPMGNERQNDGVMHGDNPIKVNGVNSPPLINVQLPVGNEGQDDGKMILGSPQVPEGNGRGNVNGVVKPLVISRINDRIRFSLCKATSKNEIKKFKKNLEDERDQVWRLYKQLESKELQVASHNASASNNNLNVRTKSISAEVANSGECFLSQPQHARGNMMDRRLLLRVNSEVGAMPHQETRPMGLARVSSDVGAGRNLEPRFYNRQLSVSVADDRVGEYAEKEKRTPKANQYYRNSEFLLGKDRLPFESNKKLKTNNKGRKHSGEAEHGMGFGFRFDKNRNQVFKNCSSLLQRLIKHKFGWVFNEPVNAKALGLVDYHDIIKHPMDLGTIKTRLSQNLYKSPREFAEDVRLVFNNAMTYNPRGQDVHIMAEHLSKIFEERWAIIESEFNSNGKYQVYQEGALPTPTSQMGLPYSHFGPASVSVSAPSSVAPQRTSDRPEPVTPLMAVDPKMHRPHVGRTPVPKKPKAKDPNKRDMTYEEKQRLSTHLQGLPPEKLDAIVQIIKKTNTALSQHDDEIEVDIDNVDAETLWELDRFVSNYKKSLSKNKRKAELALQARTMANQNVMLMNSTSELATQIESGIDFRKGSTLVDEHERNNGNRSSSSSSSSSDSGSSSSDSDSDSSSGEGSDAGHSPKA